MDQNFFYRRLVLLDIQKSYFFLLSFFLKVGILMETQNEKNQIKYTFWIYQNSVKHCKHTSDWIKLLCVNLNIGEPFLKQSLVTGPYQNLTALDIVYVYVDHLHSLTSSSFLTLNWTLGSSLSTGSVFTWSFGPSFLGPSLLDKIEVMYWILYLQSSTIL